MAEFLGIGASLRHHLARSGVFLGGKLGEKSRHFPKLEFPPMPQLRLHLTRYTDRLSAVATG
jgi:hypothetical protein